MDESVSFLDVDVSDAYTPPPFPDKALQLMNEHPFNFTPELDPTTAFTAAPSLEERVMLLTVTLSVAPAEDSMTMSEYERVSWVVVDAGVMVMEVSVSVPDEAWNKGEERMSLEVVERRKEMDVKVTEEEEEKMGEVEIFETDFETGEEEEDWTEREEVNEVGEVSAVCVVSAEYTRAIGEMLLR